MRLLLEAWKMSSLWCQKWVGILFTPSLNFVPATMNTREGFDLRVCRLVDGSALLYVPHGGRSGMLCCEVESALGMHEARAAGVRPTEYLAWVNAGGWTDWNSNSVTGREMISIGNGCMMYPRRQLSSWMSWIIKWRMVRNAKMDKLMRHYGNVHFMSLLNHLWDDIYRQPAGFVERWALKGPERAYEAWAEAETISPQLKEKKHARALFEILKDSSLLQASTIGGGSCPVNESSGLDRQ